MIELREVDTARAMLRQTAVFTRMKQEEPDRFLKLEHLCGKTYFDIRYLALCLHDCSPQAELVSNRSLCSVPATPAFGIGAKPWACSYA